MHILFVSSSSGSRGGGEGYLAYLGEALAERGHRVTLWTSSHERMDEVADRFGRFGEVIRADYRNTYDHWGRCFATCLNFSVTHNAVETWQSVNPDIIHFNKQNLEDGLDLLRGARLIEAPSVCTIHITQTAKRQGASLATVRDLMARQILKRFQGTFVTVLEERRRDLEVFLGGFERIKAISNGVPTPDHLDRDLIRSKKRAELGVGLDELLVMAAGRMVQQKRPMLYLDLAEKALRSIPKARFVWVGDGELSEEWVRSVEARRISASVMYVGWQSDVVSFYLAADVLLHTAEYEGLPFALLEAMSCELPCAITTNLLKEMPFLNAENSICVDNSDDWIASLEDRQALVDRGRVARKLVERNFSYDSMAAAYEQVYVESLKR
jgi:glycosyltransferase involved in cell wall biosynthesis